ncbi:hypothetical protein Vretimale_340 [Volvox reticuliferus]|uniref:Centrosomal protein of 44 kDa n=1 Tax=Volvox reticuliferus TaxID=1737510 RepID=A0A8J4D8I4_9CHLO|nr:hypothetical protein Vretifemale_2557 [Volvox reticuliferus]GIL94177.1 hypothetical protein Vretimale_340 [Volvox reticuliferus]
MSTGDLNGNLQRLLRELRAIKYPADVDEVGLRLGDPVALLPLFNFTLLKFSRHVARFIVQHGFELAGKTDQRFVESCFKLFRDVLNVRTVLTPAQFFEHGYAERKVLLLCDIIAVCKKLHNEEVRQERLAALKATRQHQVGSRLVAPRKSSPQVKVVRNDDMEIQQVLAPQHLPNASDGAQSVYKPKRVVAISRSPSQSPSLQPAAAKVISQPQSSPHSSHLGSHGCDLELTFRPLASVSTGQVPQRQAPAGSAAAPPPIRTWFMNPAFAGSEDGNGDLGLGTGVDVGASGRPDSRAWWRVSHSPLEQPFWRSGGETAAAAGHPMASADSSAGGAADNGRHLFFGRQTAVATTTVGASQGNLRHVVPKEPGLHTQQRQLERATVQLPQHQAAAVVQRKGGAAAAVVQPVAVGSNCAGAAASGSSHTFGARDLDEWSFSKYFGPGKAKPQRQAGNSAGDDTDDSSQHGAGDSDDGDDANIQEPSKLVVETEANLDTDGNPSDQDHRFASTRSPAGRRGGAHAASSAPAAGASPTRRQQRHQVPGVTSIAADGSSVAVDWSAQLVKLEQETQQQLQQLQSKLASAEEELEKTRSEARHTREVLQARVTVLEGRVRFLECELELCVRRIPGQDLPRAGSPGRSPPPAPGGIATEPSLSWNSPGRPRSAASTAHRRSQEPPPPPAPPSNGAAGTQHDDASAAAPTAVGLAPIYSNHQDLSLVTDTAQANPVIPPATSSMPGLAAEEECHVRQSVPVRAGGGAGTRWDGHNIVPAAAPLHGNTAAYSLHTLRDGTRGQAAQSGATAPAPGQGLTQYDRGNLPGIKPATSQPSSLPGGTRHRGPSTFSPMPQPTFSFQPSNLMQRVASAAVQPHPYHHQQQQEQQHLLQQHQSWGSTSEDGRLAGLLASGSESHFFGVSTDGAQASAQFTTGPESVGDVGQGGLHLNVSTSSVASGHVSSSSDTGARNLALNGTEDRAAGAVPWNAVAGGLYRHQAWRGPERAIVRGAGRESILSRQTAARDGPAAYGSQRQQQQDDAPFPGPGPAGFVSCAPTSQQQSQAASTAVSSHAQALGHQPGPASSGSVNGATGSVNTESLVAPPIAGGELGGGNAFSSGAPGTAGVSGGGPLNTEDVINSLYLRYTEAQDFLQTLRKR